MDYSLRLYRDDDAERLSEIIRNAIRVIGPKRYSEQQVAAWSARHPGADKFRQRVADGATILIAADANGVPVAYTLLELTTEGGAHLDHLYCDPEHTGQGLAERTLAAAEDHARDAGAERLYTEASELARAAFERAGYIITHRRDFDIPFEGEAVAIHNYAMEKPLV